MTMCEKKGILHETRRRARKKSASSRWEATLSLTGSSYHDLASNFSSRYANASLRSSSVFTTVSRRGTPSSPKHDAYPADAKLYARHCCRCRCRRSRSDDDVAVVVAGGGGDGHDGARATDDDDAAADRGRRTKAPRAEGEEEGGEEAERPRRRRGAEVAAAAEEAAARRRATMEEEGTVARIMMIFY